MKTNSFFGIVFLLFICLTNFSAFSGQINTLNPVIKTSNTIINILTFGAKGDGRLNTTAICKEIDQLALLGSGNY